MEGRVEGEIAYEDEECVYVGGSCPLCAFVQFVCVNRSCPHPGGDRPGVPRSGRPRHYPRLQLRLPAEH